MPKVTASSTVDAVGRISVLRGERLVPLLSSAPGQNSIEQPWTGVLLERHLVKPSEIPTHEHPNPCLHLQISGHDKFEWWADGKNSVEQTEPGSMILVPPGTRDRLRWQGTSERLVLEIDQTHLNQFGSQLGSVRTPEFKGSWSLSAPALRNVVSEMGREAHAGWPLGALYADLLVTTLQSQLLQYHSIAPVPILAVRGRLSPRKVRQVMEYMNARMSENIRLADLAEQAQLSPSHFAHEFRNTTGQSPYQYLLAQRMAKAKVLLKITRWPVQNICGMVGFSSPVNFVRAFRHRVGETPEAWRRRSQR